MSNGANATKSITRTVMAWLICILVMTGVVWAESTFSRSYRVLVPFLIAGVGCIILGRYVRHRWGGWALTVGCAFAIAINTFLLSTVLSDVFDIPPSSYHPDLPILLALSPSAWAMLPIGILLHRSARRPQPLLNWDLPIGLTVCALGELVGFALDLAFMIVTTPRIG